ncbi:sulfatase-like hydrolase/transferase [Gramella sp. AN32]|uniref:Sulfatase-like hydrolase/transferase n=1 Tax=Christiangramia antarctica TaxID=2058158 RepID=A0ABW5X111_9FLAO|nr:sulfatase-like hydrolase/transferase [Gramella sp. AN32]MCM4157048.1 arylsulfatase [Gramella sp. AN32]
MKDLKYFIIIFFAFTLGAQAQSHFASSNGQKNISKPNVIIIYADDLGYGDLSSYGATKIETPNVDKLATEGLKFTNAHCTAPTCTPSRYSLLTGNYPFRQTGTGILSGNAGMIIPTDKKTLAKVFKESGYSTAVVGKWHLGLGDGSPIKWNDSIKPGPNEVGFDSSFIFPATADRVPTVYLRNHTIIGLDEEDPIEVSYKSKVGNEPTGKKHPELLKMHPAPGLGHDGTIVNGISRIGWMKGGTRSRWTDEELAHDFYAESENFIRDNKKKPFFLFLSLSDIHVPRMPNTRFKGASDLGYRGDAILQMDDTVGRIMRLLEDLDIEENTMLIFTSDNGPILNDGYIDGSITKNNGHDASGKYRSGKYSIYEGGTRVPMIIRWPKEIEQGGSSSALISQVDLLATFSNYFNQSLEKDEALDSFNLWDALIGRDKKGRESMIEDATIKMIDASTQALVIGNWKYIAPEQGPVRLSWAIDIDGGQETGLSAEPQLYNLEKDPGELNNVAKQHPERLKQMKNTLQEAIKSGHTRKHYNNKVK